MTLDVNDIHSLTDFQRNAKAHVTHLRKTKMPMVLTVNGSAAVVVQDVVTYQKMVDQIAAADERDRLVKAVRAGQAAKASGDVHPVREVIAARRSKRANVQG